MKHYENAEPVKRWACEFKRRMNLSFVGFSGKGIFPFRSEVIFLVRSEEDVETVRNSRVNEHFHASVPSHPPDWPAASNTMYSPAHGG